VVVKNSLWNRHLACSGEGCNMGVTTRKNTKNKVPYPIATAQTLKKFLISETLAIVTASSFFLLPSSFGYSFNFDYDNAISQIRSHRIIHARLFLRWHEISVQMARRASQ
jgi:hypothetical protein